MAHKYAEIAFTENVKAVQQELGSRPACESKRGHGIDGVDGLGPDEAAFIAERDSFYMATVSQTGWPYIQHRGGPAGFIRTLDETTLGFIDYRGNRQYISVGNLRGDDRVSLFFMDYENAIRLKLFGRARIIDLQEADGLGLTVPEDGKAHSERAVIFDVQGVDWNGSQHIPQKIELEKVQEVIGMLQDQIDALKEKLPKCRH